MTDLVTLENLEVRFGLHQGETVAVHDVSFRIRRGGTVALVGESGSGKSTVAQAILGILPKNGRVSAGRILFDDSGRCPGGPRVEGRVDLARLPVDGPGMRALRGCAVSMIFQDPMTSLSPLHTIGDQVGEALRLHSDTPAHAVKAEVLHMLDRVGFPDPARAYDLFPFELSGGMRQRAMIAMALIPRPDLLIADEPTTALDVTVQAQILRLIKDLQQEFKMAVLLVTHDLGVVANVSDETVVMYQGRVVESGPTELLFAQPRHDYLKALLRALPRLHGHDGERLVPLRPVSVHGGNLMARGRAAETTGALLTVEGLSKTFTAKKGGWFGVNQPRVRAVNNVSFAIERGESVGLVGESGCGKTTVSKIIMRALRPDGGRITYDDGDGPVNLLDIDGKNLIPWRRKIQYVFQDPASSLDPRMTVFGLIGEPLKIHGIGDHTHRAALVKELMSLVGLDHRFLNRYPHSFSGGQKQRIGVARALALQPDLLLCDEPVSALDVSVQAQVLNLLKDLQEALSLTYLFVSHNLAVVRYLCTRILVMCKGRIVEEGPTETLFEAPVHPYTRALLASVPDPDGGSAWLSGRGLATEEGASTPDAWPSPYTLTGDSPGQMTDLGGGHRVLAGATEAAA